ncbi:rho-related GTP-binding protein RhoF isoform X1 [Crocuta crocuta]
MEAPRAPGPDPGRKELKIVIVGDGGCGKTSLLMVYSQGSFPEHYAPSVFEKYTASVTVGSKEVTLNLYDTAGQEDYDRLRPLSYQNTHLVLICYDVMNPTSYENVLIKVRPVTQPACLRGGDHGSGLSLDACLLPPQWFPEVTHFCRGTPMVLIGCKTDLRKDKEQLRKLRAAQLEPITYVQVGRGSSFSPPPSPCSRPSSSLPPLILITLRHVLLAPRFMGEKWRPREGKWRLSHPANMQCTARILSQSLWLQSLGP